MATGRAVGRYDGLVRGAPLRWTVLLPGLLIACSSYGDPFASVPPMADAGPQPYDIQCSWGSRFTAVRSSPFKMRSDATAERAWPLTGANLNLKTSSGEGEPPTTLFHAEMYSDAPETWITYDAILSRYVKPSPPFAEGGFTGYLSINEKDPLQFGCGTDEFPPRANNDPNAYRPPFQIACEYAYRSPNPAVDPIELRSSFVAARQDHHFFGSFSFGINVSTYGVSIAVHDWTAPFGAALFVRHEVLFSGSGTRRLVNPTLGPYGLTGRFAVRHPNGEDLAWGCSAE